MDIATVLAQLRNKSGYTQIEAADFISRRSGKPYSHKAVSRWETGVSEPPVEHFLLLCELYGVEDIQNTFRGLQLEYRDFPKLNARGKKRAEEYIAMLTVNPLFSEHENSTARSKRRILRLHDTRVAAGTGSFLNGDSYEEFEADDTVPKEADFAVRVSGDSMTPRFVDGQIIFIKEQRTLEQGEIGIFELNGDAYVKRLGSGELISLNPSYKPIPVHEYDSFRVFGKVVG